MCPAVYSCVLDQHDAERIQKQLCKSLIASILWLQGKTLTNSVKQIFTDFQSAAEKFQKLNYDAMNVEVTQFATDFAIFCGVIRELERRLGAVIAQVLCPVSGTPMISCQVLTPLNVHDLPADSTSLACLAEPVLHTHCLLNQASLVCIFMPCGST